MGDDEKAVTRHVRGADASSSPEPRKASFAQCDYLRFRRAFDHVAAGGAEGQQHEHQHVSGADLVKVAARLGYDISPEQLKDILSNNGLTETSPITFEQFLDAVPGNRQQIRDEEHRLADLREKFARYDVDGNGRISLAEAQWALQGELDVTPATALRLLDQFVQLDYVQFAAFYDKVQKKKLEMFEKFGKYDQNQDGLISVDEAHRVLKDELGLSADKCRALVNRFDLNKDGSVSYMEFAEFYLAVEDKKSKIRHSFRRFDSADSGHVTLEQARHILVDLLGFSEAKCAHAIDTYDRDHNGRIEYEEFVDFYVMVEEERARLLREFVTYDSDGDGKISRTEFEDMLNDKGYTSEARDTLIKGFDTDTEGYWTFDEFKRFLNFK